ncbi:hypothetical protein [Variovorax sp. JS1663]|uniref:hypothetical protein n=1 Tax=Variovorax sp. JS1663 TaxID=1851577 RepID=UPI000B342340|nr:hypothetical protein [Variovorax sp. JS1663]OUL99323.1 hypothetical protein A8M77_27195 [Variovorax sp. JS1663]
MKTVVSGLLCATIALATGMAFAQDTKKPEARTKDRAQSQMTTQECKEHMAMSKKGEMKMDDAMMKMCSDMMKKEKKASTAKKQ